MPSSLRSEAPLTLLIGLGANLGGLEQAVTRFAIAATGLSCLGQVTKSKLYKSEPVGEFRGGPGLPHPNPRATRRGESSGPASDVEPFFNAAVLVSVRGLSVATEANSLAILALLQTLERKLGRVRSPGNLYESRTIDIDWLCWGNFELRHPALQLPHPRFGERRFALLPMIDLVGPTYQVNWHGQPVELATLAAATIAQQVSVVNQPW